MSVVDDKAVVKEYFNATGFERWRRIYGNDEVNFVQKNIRVGHQKTVDTAIAWLSDSDLSEISVCDAGCGVGSLSIPLAQAGAQVSASDISEKMVDEARARAQSILGQSSNPTFTSQDLESLTGKYHTVVCLDVLIHYPQEQAATMVAHLSSLAESRLMMSFAPKNVFYSNLKKVGSFFPGASKATRAYLHSEQEIGKMLESSGWQIQRRALNQAPFYFSRLLEAVRSV